MKQKFDKWNRVIELLQPTKKPNPTPSPTGKSMNFKEFRQGLAR
jgi:hypothetical protein